MMDSLPATVYESANDGTVGTLYQELVCSCLAWSTPHEQGYVRYLTYHRGSIDVPCSFPSIVP